MHFIIKIHLILFCSIQRWAYVSFVLICSAFVRFPPVYYGQEYSKQLYGAPTSCTRGTCSAVGPTTRVIIRLMTRSHLGFSYENGLAGDSFFGLTIFPSQLFVLLQFSAYALANAFMEDAGNAILLLKSNHLRTLLAIRFLVIDISHSSKNRSKQRSQSRRSSFIKL